MSKDKNITGLTSLRFNSQNGVSVAGNKIDNADSSSQTRGLALPQVLNDDQRDKIVNSDNSNTPILFGTAVYNIDAKSAQITKEDNNGNASWANIGTGNLSNDGASTDTAIVIFDGTDGTKTKDSAIKIANVPSVSDANIGAIVKGHIVIFNDAGKTEIKDGGFVVARDVNAANQANATNQDRYLMSNFGAIEFINGDGSVLLDSLSAFTMHTQGTGASARACTVFSGDLPAGSSSPSAVLELNTNEGVLLLSRLSTPEEEMLDTLKSGSFWYNKDLNRYRGCQNGTIITFGEGGGGGNISPTGIITKDGVAVWNDSTGTLLRSSTTTINSLGGITINVSGYQNQIGGNGNIYDHNGTTYTVITPTLAVPEILTFVYPSNQPIAGYILTTDDDGNTSWVSKTAVNISNLTSSANSYTLQNDEHFIAVDTSTSSQEILLPLSSTVSNGIRYLVKDASGFAGINNITIKAQGTNLIEGNTQVQINTNYGFVELINNQNNQWLII
jgi:hypothetical protein